MTSTISITKLTKINLSELIMPLETFISTANNIGFAGHTVENNLSYFKGETESDKTIDIIISVHNEKLIIETFYHNKSIGYIRRAAYSFLTDNNTIDEYRILTLLSDNDKFKID
jgi:hypothetical protein